MALIPRDERAIHDQIMAMVLIELRRLREDLVGLDTTQLMAMVLIELRRLREDLAGYQGRNPAKEE